MSNCSFKAFLHIIISGQKLQRVPLRSKLFNFKKPFTCKATPLVHTLKLGSIVYWVVCDKTISVSLRSTLKSRDDTWASAIRWWSEMWLKAQEKHIRPFELRLFCHTYCFKNEPACSQVAEWPKGLSAPFMLTFFYFKKCGRIILRFHQWLVSQRKTESLDCGVINSDP